MTGIRPAAAAAALLLALPPVVAAPPAGAAPAVAAFAPVVHRAELPHPTGPYAVGQDVLELVDRDRPDPWVPSAGPRRLMASVYYPAKAGTGNPAPYMTPGVEGLARHRHPLRQEARELPRRPSASRRDDLDQGPHQNHPLITTEYAPWPSRPGAPVWESVSGVRSPGAVVRGGTVPAHGRWFLGWSAGRHGWPPGSDTAACPDEWRCRLRAEVPRWGHHGPEFGEGGGKTSGRLRPVRSRKAESS